MKLSSNTIEDSKLLPRMFKLLPKTQFFVFHILFLLFTPLAAQEKSIALVSRVEVDRMFISHQVGGQFSRKRLSGEFTIGYLPDRAWRTQHLSIDSGLGLFYLPLKSDRFTLQMGAKFKSNFNPYPQNTQLRVHHYGIGFTGFWGIKFQFSLGLHFGLASLGLDRTNCPFLDYGASLGIRYNFKRS